MASALTKWKSQGPGAGKGEDKKKEKGRELTSHLWAAPPSFTWVTTIAWGERFDPRPPLTWIPSPSDSLSSSSFHIRPTSSLEEKSEHTMKYTDRCTALTQERGAVGSGLILITFQQTSQVTTGDKMLWGLEQVSLAVLSNRMFSDDGNGLCLHHLTWSPSHRWLFSAWNVRGNWHNEF